MATGNGAAAFAATALAAELAPIRVNAVSPGITDSGTWDRLGADGKDTFLSAAAEGTLAGRVGTLKDIVDTVMWLLTAGFVTGETIHVDGGAAISGR